MDSTEKIAVRLKNVLKEFTDGAVIVGFAANGEAFVVTHAPDTKTTISLNAMLNMLLHSGGVQCEQPHPQGGGE